MVQNLALKTLHICRSSREGGASKETESEQPGRQKESLQWVGNRATEERVSRRPGLTVVDAAGRSGKVGSGSEGRPTVDWRQN